MKVNGFEERDYIKEALIVVPAFLAGLYLIGKATDLLLNGEKKAEEAKKQNYDI